VYTIFFIYFKLDKKETSKLCYWENSLACLTSLMGIVLGIGELGANEIT
jgi:hypothetical protein